MSRYTILALFTASTVLEPVAVTTRLMSPTGNPVVLKVPLIDPALWVGVFIANAVTDVDPRSVPLVLRADTVNVLPGEKPPPVKARGVPEMTWNEVGEMKGALPTHAACMNGVVFSTFAPALTTRFNEPVGRLLSKSWNVPSGRA